MDAIVSQTFHFQGSDLPLSFCGTYSGSMNNVHIALQELQVVALILHKLAYHLSSKFDALHFNKSTTKDYLCNAASIVCFFSVQIDLPLF